MELKFFAFRPISSTRIFPFQAIPLIRPPGLPAETADRRIWFYSICDGCLLYHHKDFRFLRYSAISSSLTVSMMCCSSLTTESLSLGSQAVTG